jgi:hypothetical protein
MKYRHLTWLFHKDIFVDVMVKYRFCLLRTDRSYVIFSQLISGAMYHIPCRHDYGIET